MKIYSIFCFVFVLLFIPCYSQNKTSEEIHSIQNEAKERGNQWNKDSYLYSAELFEEASEHWLKLNEFSNSSECLRKSAQLRLILAQNEKAKMSLKKAYEIDEISNDPISKAKTLSFLSQLLTTEGSYEEGINNARTALNLSQSSSDNFAQALAIYSLAEIQYSQNPAEIALESYLIALEFAKLIDDSRLTAQILLGLSYTYAKMGNPTLALQFSKESLSKWIESGDQRGQAVSQITIGLSYKMSGETQKALDSYFSAEKMFPSDLDFIEHARLFNAIGAIYSDYKDNQKEEICLRSAYLFYQKANYPRGQLATLPSLIKISLLNEKPVEADNYYNELKRLSNKLNNDFFLGFTQIYFGNAKLQKNLPEEAIKHFNLALKLSEKYRNQSYYAVICQKLGEAYKQKGIYTKSREYLSNSININRNIQNKYLEAENLFYLSEINLLENKAENALNLIQKSVELTESLYTDVINSNLKRTYFSNVFDRYELYIGLLMKMEKQFPNKDYANEALRAAERSRARSMMENLALSEAKFTKDADPEIVKQEKEIRILINIKANKLTDLLSQNADKNETDKISKEMNELENQLEEIMAILKQNSPVYYAIKNPAPFDVADFQEQILDENSLLLEFSFGKEESYLWVVGKTEVDSYVLPPREQIETKIQKLRELLSARRMIKGEEIEAYQARIVQAENEFWQTAKQLSDEVFGQAADKFGNKRLIIVPDGKLNYFPVSALPLPHSETGDPILLSNEVVYEPSASTLSILSNSQNQTSGATKNLLVFSDPVFTKEDSRISVNNSVDTSNTETASLESFRFVESLNSLSRLPASKTEADSIIDILGRSYTDNYSGFAANREQLLNANAADYKILHFATHGLINEERPELSGIVLSRFSENGQKMDEFIRLHDIYGMNLNSDLVVLSACETGIGKEVRGEGLMSLNNAFLQVGAKSVMSSLWKVEDNATLELMKNFYQSLAHENTTPSKALQQAQIKMWQSGRYKSPFYWAAFTVQGDFRRAPEFSRNFPYAIVFSAAGLAFFVFGIFWLFRRNRGKARLLNQK